MQKAIPLAQETIVNLVKSGSKIPKWILTEFKARGYFNDLSGVRVVTETQDPEQLKADVQSLSIGGGGEEEVLLGERCQGVRGSMYLTDFGSNLKYFPPFSRNPAYS